MMTFAKTITFFLAFLMLKSPVMAFQFPDNDTHQSAFKISLGPNGNYFSKEGQFNTVGASGDGVRYSQWGDRATRSVWFQFIAPEESDQFIITVSDLTKGEPKSYIQLALLNDELQELESTTSGYRSHAEQMIYTGLKAGQQYYILVDNPTDSEAIEAFTLKVQNLVLNQCTQPFQLALNQNGKAQLKVEDLVNGDCYWPCSSVECSRELDKTNFTCNDLGDNYVTVKGVGGNGKAYFGTYLVKVVDEIPPTIAVKNVRANIVNGNYIDVDPMNVIQWRCEKVGSLPSPNPVPGVGDVPFFQQAPCAQDNCGIEKFELSKTRFTCDDLGENEVMAKVTDKSGNEATTKVIITVYDMTAPKAIAAPTTVYLNETGKGVFKSMQLWIMGQLRVAEGTRHH